MDFTVGSSYQPCDLFKAGAKSAAQQASKENYP
jgi:hypothetical protein